MGDNVRELASGRVLIERQASREEAEAVRRVLRDANVNLELAPSDTEYRGAEFPWETIIEVSPIAGFLLQLGAEGAKALVEEIRRARRPGPGNVRMRDPALRQLVLLTEDLPEEAWEQLRRLPKQLQGVLIYDRDKGQWVRA